MDEGIKFFVGLDAHKGQYVSRLPLLIPQPPIQI
jgi:hypothetical protein